MATSPQLLEDRYPRRAIRWKLRTKTLEFGRTPVLMGIVNVTPDSFSDGGKFAKPRAAVEQALRLDADGAGILDIGGESTRPYVDPIGVEEELARVIPVVEAVAGRTETPISIDTSKSAVAGAALAAGAEIVNDVTGLTGDSKMLGVALQSGAGVCAMHMQGTPQIMQDDPQYVDVVEDIYNYLQQRRDDLVAARIDAERVCLDPGIGFGKTHQHNLTLMAGCGRFHQLGCPLLVGHSRKGFLGKLLGDKQADRTAASVGGALALAAQGVQVIRVHDVRPVQEALWAFAATGGIDGVESVLAE
ncbi:MAG: dihydropteroate synthase [Bythopirellula sp.]